MEKKLDPSVLQKHLSPEELPQIADHRWPRHEAKLTRLQLRAVEKANAAHQVTVPPAGFVNDPTEGEPRLPEPTEMRCKILQALLASVFVTTPHKQMQEALHKKGLVIINWPYEIRPFFEKRPAELTGVEIGKLIRALLHPNPASRVQLISRHHFSREKQPGYVSYISSFHETPQKRQIIDEDYNEDNDSPVGPLIIVPPAGRCSCHLSTCKPIDLSKWINIDNTVVIPKTTESDSPRRTKRKSDHLNSKNSQETSSCSLDQNMPKTRSASGSTTPKHRAPDGSSKVPRLSQHITADESGPSYPSPSAGIIEPSPNRTSLVGTVGYSAQPAQTSEPSQPLFGLRKRLGQTPAQQIGKAMVAVLAIRDPSVNIDFAGKQEMVWKILDSLDCIPPIPTFPPATENAWSDIAELAASHHVDPGWLLDRMARWFSHILEISTVPIEDLVVTIRAVRKLLHVANLPLKQKFVEEAEKLILRWWINLVPPTALRIDYNRAWCLLGELSDLRDINFEDEDTIQLCWKRAFRQGLKEEHGRAAL